MPHFGALAEGGVFTPMESSIPEVSSVAWSSVITGTNPGEHGVYGFTDIAPGTYRTFPQRADGRVIETRLPPKDESLLESLWPF